MGCKEVHVVVVPCPTQGHVNPLLQFAKHLSHHGLNVTFPAIFPKTKPNPHSRLTIQQISLLPYQGTEPETAIALWGRRQASIRLHLTDLLSRHQRSDDDDYFVSCVVYDSMMPWVLDVAKEFGVLGASFFTQSSAVNAIYYNVYKGWLDVPLQQPSISLDGFPILQTSDVSSFLFDPVKYAMILEFMTKQFEGLDRADWILVNTFDSLEPQEGEWMRKQLPMIKNIGPMVPSIYLDRKIPKDKDYGLSLFESTNKDSTMKWLDSRDNYSVVYVSFGSLTEAKDELMEEVAMGLKQINKFFLWVVRESEIHKLPTNFIEDTHEKGLVVNWCSQLEVLTHKSIACFVSHCGWNSTLEALSLGVPLVALAQWSDQPTNAKYVEDVWKIGKRLKMDQHGICTRDQIEICINEVMEGSYSNEIRENLKKWKEMAKVAMDDGGSSNININHFVEELVKKTQL